MFLCVLSCSYSRAPAALPSCEYSRLHNPLARRIQREVARHEIEYACAISVRVLIGELAITRTVSNPDDFWVASVIVEYLGSLCFALKRPGTGGIEGSQSTADFGDEMGSERDRCSENSARSAPESGALQFLSHISNARRRRL